MELGILLIRKSLAVFVTTLLVSTFMSISYLLGTPKTIYEQGSSFIAWSLIFSFYIGLIIIIYGTTISTLTEYLQNKWFPKHDWLYIFILTICGSANGIWFKESVLAFTGMAVAFIFAIIDKYLKRRITNEKNVNSFFFTPLALVIVVWGYFQFFTDPLLPFTEEMAVEMATSGEGTTIEKFPKEIGIWEGTIDGFFIKRETSAKKVNVKKELYEITFTESWRYISKEHSSKEYSWSMTYHVDRNSSSLRKESGPVPLLLRLKLLNSSLIYNFFINRIILLKK